MGFKAHVFLSNKRKGRDLNPRVKKIHLPDFESGAVPSWATFPEFKIST